MKIRPEAEIWPIMSDEELRSLAAHIETNGQLETIKLYKKDILDGRNRWTAITKFCNSKTKPKFEDVDPVSPMAYVIGRNKERRHLTDGQKALSAAIAIPFFE